MTSPPTPPAAPEPLADLRHQINELDEQILQLLARRYAILPEVVRVKAAHGISHRVQSRVAEVLARNTSRGTELGLPEQMVREIWEAIIEAAHRYEGQFLDH